MQLLRFLHLLALVLFYMTYISAYCTNTVTWLCLKLVADNALLLMSYCNSTKQRFTIWCQQRDYFYISKVIKFGLKFSCFVLRSIFNFWNKVFLLPQVASYANKCNRMAINILKEQQIVLTLLLTWFIVFFPYQVRG